MPRGERRARWRQMADRLARHSIHRWFTTFLDELKSPRPTVVPLPAAKAPSIRPSLPQEDTRLVRQQTT
jgi:trehalose-6-phosphate synthase